MRSCAEFYTGRRERGGRGWLNLKI